MYYCSICNFLGSDEGEYSGAVCPKCGRPLYATKVSKEEWSRKRESDKRLLKSKWLQNIAEESEKSEFALSASDARYEYDVVTILNEGHGRIDTSKMRTILAQKAAQGWKLHTVYSNELGKNALMILGLGVNSTACEDVLIFEREIEK